MKLPWQRRRTARAPEPGDREKRDEVERDEILRLPVTPLRKHARLEPVEATDVLVSVGVGPGGQAVALWANASGRGSLQSVTVCAGGAIFPNARSSAPPASITVHDPTIVQAIHLREIPIAHPFVQPLSDGRALLVGARCEWHDAGPDRNAVTVDAEGETIAAATLGDGIAHVETSPADDIWVGYFDEGVYGNYGWGGPGPEPVGSAGLLRWTADLQVAWRYDSRFGALSDCYALNVDGDAAWACYYDDFPIVKVNGDDVSGWRNEVDGAGSLIVGGAQAALVGGYGPQRDHVVLGDLSHGDFQPRFTTRLVLDGGTELPPTDLMTGRGGDLHVFVAPDWYRLDLSDVERACVRTAGRMAPGQARARSTGPSARRHAPMPIQYQNTRPSGTERRPHASPCRSRHTAPKTPPAASKAATKASPYQPASFHRRRRTHSRTLPMGCRRCAPDPVSWFASCGYDRKTRSSAGVARSFGSGDHGNASGETHAATPMTTSPRQAAWSTPEETLSRNVATKKGSRAGRGRSGSGKTETKAG